MNTSSPIILRKTRNMKFALALIPYASSQHDRTLTSSPRQPSSLSLGQRTELSKQETVPKLQKLVFFRMVISPSLSNIRFKVTWILIVTVCPNAMSTLLAWIPDTRTRTLFLWLTPIVLLRYSVYPFFHQFYKYNCWY